MQKNSTNGFHQLIFGGKFCPKPKCVVSLNPSTSARYTAQEAKEGFHITKNTSVPLSHIPIVGFVLVGFCGGCRRRDMGVGFLAFLLVIGTDWQSWIKRYFVYPRNKRGFNKLPRNFCVLVSQHWTGIERWCHVHVHTVTRTFLPHPQNLQKWHTSFEMTAESSVKNVIANWTKQIHFLPYWSCYPENTALYHPGLPTLLPVTIPLKSWRCIVYIQLQIRAGSDPYFPQRLIFNTDNKGSNHANYTTTFSTGGLKQYNIRAEPAVGTDDWERKCALESS